MWKLTWCSPGRKRTCTRKALLKRKVRTKATARHTSRRSFLVESLSGIHEWCYICAWYFIKKHDSFHREACNGSSRSLHLRFHLPVWHLRPQCNLCFYVCWPMGMARSMTVAQQQMRLHEHTLNMRGSRSSCVYIHFFLYGLQWWGIGFVDHSRYAHSKIYTWFFKQCIHVCRLKSERVNSCTPDIWPARVWNMMQDFISHVLWPSYGKSFLPPVCLCPAIHIAKMAIQVIRAAYFKL